MSADGETLVFNVATNFGGKSIILPSIGQAQIMMQCGMLVSGDLLAQAFLRGCLVTSCTKEIRK
jgi:hypothetical protein